MWLLLQTWTSVESSNIPLRAHGWLVQKVTRELRQTSQELQASFAPVYVSVQDSIMRPRLEKWYSLASCKVNTTASWGEHKGSSHICQKTHWGLKNRMGKCSVVLLVQSGIFKRCSRWHKANTEFHNKNSIPTVICSCGSEMAWGCLAASGSGQFAITDVIMNSAFYQNVLMKIIGSSVRSLNLNCNWSVRTSPPLTVSKGTKGFGVTKSKSSLESEEILWQDPVRAVPAQKPARLN